jgi:Zn-dependent protease with chaperone function
MEVTGRYGSDYNAYAASGRVMVTSQFLNLCRTDAELVIILGHELAHQTHVHLVRKTARYPVSDLIADIIATPFLLLSPVYNGDRHSDRKSVV